MKFGCEEVLLRSDTHETTDVVSLFWCRLKLPKARRSLNKSWSRRHSRLTTEMSETDARHKRAPPSCWAGMSWRSKHLSSLGLQAFHRVYKLIRNFLTVSDVIVTGVKLVEVTMNDPFQENKAEVLHFPACSLVDSSASAVDFMLSSSWIKQVFKMSLLLILVCSPSCWRLITECLVCVSEVCSCMDTVHTGTNPFLCKWHQSRQVVD